LVLGVRVYADRSQAHERTHDHRRS
jgi:hypothetical protein